MIVNNIQSEAKNIMNNTSVFCSSDGFFMYSRYRTKFFSIRMRYNKELGRFRIIANYDGIVLNIGST